MSRDRVPVSPAQVNAFYAEAEVRYVRIMKSGKAIPWLEMRAYLEARIAGKPVQVPKPTGSTGNARKTRT